MKTNDFFPKWMWVSFLGFIGLLFIAIGIRDFWPPVEAGFGLVIREMLESGNFIVPTQKGAIYSDKPPLYFWLSIGFTKIFFQAELSEFFARLPSLLAALFSLGVVGWLGNRMFGNRSGLFALLVLATTYRFWWQAVWCHLDMLLSFFILSALACFWWGYTQTHSKKKSLWVWSLFYLCLAGGFMTKGPIGLIFPCGILFFFLLFERKLSFLLKMWIPLGIFIFIAVVGSWLWGAYIQAGPEYVYDHLIRHNFTRYTTGWRDQRPIYYYFTHFPLDCLPWVLFLPFAVKFAWSSRENRAPYRFLTIWFALIFLFFTLSSSKRDLYLLPLYPAVALFLGSYFSAKDLSFRIRKAFRVTYVATSLIIAAVLLVGYPWVNKNYHTARAFCEEVKTHLSENEKVGSYKSSKVTIIYYMGGITRIHNLDSEEKLTEYLRESNSNKALVRHRHLKMLQEKFPIEVLAEKKVGHRHFCLVKRKG